MYILISSINMYILIKYFEKMDGVSNLSVRICLGARQRGCCLINVYCVGVRSYLKVSRRLSCCVANPIRNFQQPLGRPSG